MTALTMGHHTFGTLGSLLVGLLGAGYCSIKGFRVVLDNDVTHMVLRRNRNR